MYSSSDKQTQPFCLPFDCLNIRLKIGLRPVADIWTDKLKHQHTKEFSIKDRQLNDYKQSETFFWQSAGERCLTQLCDVISQCISYKHSQQDVLSAFIDTLKQISVFTGKRCNFQSSRKVISRALTCFVRYTIHEKKIQCDCQEKNLAFFNIQPGTA